MAENKLRLLEQSQEYDGAGNLSFSANLIITGGSYIAANQTVNGTFFLGASNTPQSWFGGSPGFLQQDQGNKSFGGFLRYDTSAYGASLALGKSNNATIGAQGAVSNNGTSLGDLVFLGSNGTTWNALARMIVELDGAATGASMPTRIRFLLTPSGSLTETEVLRFNSNGAIQSHLSNGAPVWCSTTGGLQIVGFSGAIQDFFPQGGLELANTSGGNRVLSYDRGTSGYLPLQLVGSDVLVGNGGGTLISLTGPSWTNFTFGTNVAAYGNGWATPSWYQDPNGRVHFRGLLQTTGSVAGGEQIVSAVPVPSTGDVMFGQLQSGGGVVRVDVNSSGQVILQTSLGSGAWFTLDGISYQTK